MNRRGLFGSLLGAIAAPFNARARTRAPLIRPRVGIVIAEKRDPTDAEVAQLKTAAPLVYAMPAYKTTGCPCGAIPAQP
jgi:hypothetical protein